MKSDFNEVVDHYDKIVDAQFEKSKITAMVLGPNTSLKRHSSILRKFIIDEFDSSVTVILGEHKALSKSYTRRFKAAGNLCSFERDIARNEADVVVIIPDSAGSLVELGMFALDDDVSFKTLILFNQAHISEENKSFIQAGPQIAYETRGASVEIVDYRSKKKIKNIVEKFFFRFRAIKYDRQ